MTPLSLTHEQLDIVMAAARAVPVQWRSRMLQGIADILMPLAITGGEIDDGDVQGAVDHVLSRMRASKGEAA